FLHRHLLGRAHHGVLLPLERSVEVATRVVELLREQLDGHTARRRTALVAAHAVGDREHAGLGIDEIAVLVALAFAPGVPLAPRPQSHAYSADRSLMLPSSQRRSLPLPSTFVSSDTGRVHSFVALRSVSRAWPPSRSVPSWTCRSKSSLRFSKLPSSTRITGC